MKQHSLNLQSSQTPRSESNHSIEIEKSAFGTAAVKKGGVDA